MSARNYNKLYVHTDREEGSEKILLGYQNDVKETVLVKDVETTFHVPPYTAPIKINDSALIQEGATAGPFPAAADRIFKNLKDYGNVTVNGTATETSNGVWFCSWLYKNEFGQVQWMDRYYNPGHFVISAALSQLSETPAYKKHDPMYQDIPSTMTLEPGVQYRYFHVGEKTAKELVNTFGGVDGERIKLNLENWGSEKVNTSSDTTNVKINTNGSSLVLYNTLTEVDRISASTISFDNSYDTSVSVNYDKAYALENEFSLAFWVQSNNWKESQSTQLVGNFCSNGGVGLFIDTLSSYPFFVIPETGYGHLLYANEKINSFLDKSLQLTVSLTATPKFVAIDSENNVVICNADNSHKLNKFDNAGKLLASVTLEQITETPMQIICGMNDDIIVMTDKTRYTYDTNLVLLNQLPYEQDSNSIASFAYDTTAGTAELIVSKNVRDSKFIGTTHWCISASDGNLYKKSSTQSSYELYAQFTSRTDSKATRLSAVASSFAIDPYDRLWVMHGNNKVSVYNSNLPALSNPVFKFDIVDQNFSHTQQNISFICAYDRTTGTREWKCLLYYSDEPDYKLTPRLYVYNMNGVCTQTADILSFFNLDIINSFNQEQRNFQFVSKGDFTGYERRRVFNKLPPYNNEPQLVLKALLKNKVKSKFPYVIFKTHSSINGWNYKSWQHIVLTLQNREFKCYVNGFLAATMTYSSQHELSYSLQPTLFIGTPAGSQAGFNQEIKCSSAIFNGRFQDVKIYDYVLDFKKLEVFQRATIPAQNIYWSLPTPSIQYIEKIERMFKNKVPGAKATFFNVKLRGTQITDTQTRMIIEQELRNVVEKIKPAYANFLGIHWVD